MNSTSWLGSAESALRAASPPALLSTARALLADKVDAHDVELLLADYSLSVLQPVTHLPSTGVPTEVRDGGAAGRAFTAEAPVMEITDEPGTVVVHLPVTVRGDRLGVLSVRLPEQATRGASGVLELAAFATALGHELIVAERDTDVYLQARRRRRLTLAAEMQWQLLPGRGFSRDEFTLGAHLEPAYAVGGDNFDWSVTDTSLTITVTDGQGHGIQAALLTNLTVNALRNARRAGISLVDQAFLADQAVYGEYGGSSPPPPCCCASTWPPVSHMWWTRDLPSCSAFVAARWNKSNSTRNFPWECSRRPSTARNSSALTPEIASSS